ncbi:MAG: DUF6285 domain-containing protein [Acidimicrobiales bacterium]|nr:DUF6285 domain-containing protein [Acidimicrobiales bacterium]
MPEELDLELPPRTNAPYDAPSAQELVEAVKFFISEELLDEVPSTQKWKLRIASNVLAIAGREIENYEIDKQSFENFLSSLNMGSERELSLALRNGDFDNNLGTILTKLMPIIEIKLLVANPAYLVSENKI